MLNFFALWAQLFTLCYLKYFWRRGWDGVYASLRPAGWFQRVSQKILFYQIGSPSRPAARASERCGGWWCRRSSRSAKRASMAKFPCRRLLWAVASLTYSSLSLFDTMMTWTFYTSLQIEQWHLKLPPAAKRGSRLRSSPWSARRRRRRRGSRMTPTHTMGLR